MKRKVLLVFLAIAIALSCLSLPISAFALTRPIELNVRTTNHLDGDGDLNWYTFTPEKSGTYSFLSYNAYASEAYLFIKEKGEGSNRRVYKQLAYSQGDPNYQEHGNNHIQFCLTYHLDAGVTYYYACGWLMQMTYDRDVTAMTVMLKCDSYDEKTVDHIVLSCNATLSAYNDGWWDKDTNGVSFYYYNISRIIANMKITVYYTDGRISYVNGGDEVDGYKIMYKHTQYKDHWYAQSTDDYKSNKLTVEVVDASADFEVPINIDPMHGVKGIVQDYAGNPVENAAIYSNGVVIARTDKTGKFAFSLTAGLKVFTVSADHAIDRKITITVSATQYGNDFTEKPIRLVTCDYVKDGIINAKDYAYISKNLDNQQMEKQKLQFKKAIHFTKENYEQLDLSNPGVM